jgi:hypothetical protein
VSRGQRDGSLRPYCRFSRATNNNNNNNKNNFGFMFLTDVLIGLGLKTANSYCDYC